MPSSNLNRQQGLIGKRRARSTRRSVIVTDRIARALITLGGLGTIVAVSLVCVFLTWVVVPLFLGESLSDPVSRPIDLKSEAKLIHLGTDDYFEVGWCAFADGTLRSFKLDTGEVIGEHRLYAAGGKMTAWSFDGDRVAIGFADGTLQIGRIEFSSDTIAAADVPAGVKEADSGQPVRFRDGLLKKTPEGQFRLQHLAVALEAPVTVKAGTAIRLIALTIEGGESASEGAGGGTEIVSLLTDDAELRMARLRRTRNILTNKISTRLIQGTLQLDLPKDRGWPSYLRLAGLGDCVYLAWNDGRILRFDTRDATRPVLAEEIDLIPEDAELTAFEFLIGKASLAVADSQGGVSVWFRTKPEAAPTVDGSLLTAAHRLPRGTAGVTALSASARSRMLAAGYANGEVQVFHVTSEQALVGAAVEPAAPISAIALSPKDGALLALTQSAITAWSLNAPHPEISLSSIASPVWYEGYEKPEHVWQSSSGTQDFEPKYGLAPLVFGTLKATFYSMLFGAPLAILAAIYTSGFLHPRTRARVKPTIEIMASLPSVVLGFLAALFFAPLLEDVVPELLTAFATVPFALLLGAYLWQLFSPSTAVRLRRLRVPSQFVMLVAGLGLAWLTGRTVEHWLFDGDLKAWLDGQVGTGLGGWMLLLLPISAIVIAVFSNRVVTPQLRNATENWTRRGFVLLDLGKYLLCCLATLALAWVLAAILTAAGWDPRGSFVDTYVQRNALIVGFIMGFAIIPIIFTISDDALTAVPESLRAASLGCGATQWQTAVKVIIPTAMSGLFSAVMIGLGRAVGETMIVLMAAGNTPVMKWNPFDGFRTLSANIAVELPEAVADSTHFRMLFLAALTLFALTFVLNTIAEIVRLRFRKRAFQL